MAATCRQPEGTLFAQPQGLCRRGESCQRRSGLFRAVHGNGRQSLVGKLVVILLDQRGKPGDAVAGLDAGNPGEGESGCIEAAAGGDEANLIDRAVIEAD
jgi:hypothetical protein